MSLSTKFKSLSSDSQAGDVLRLIIQSGQPEPGLVQLLIDDLSSTILEGSTDKATKPTHAALALLAIKTLGRQPAGSKVIASAKNLQTLLALSSTLKKSDLTASLEALRCIANALLLVEVARSTFITEEVGGGSICVSILEGTASPDLVFLVSRILFLCTASSLQSGEFITKLVQDKLEDGTSIVQVISNKLAVLTEELAKDTKMSREATTDLLKLVFNLLVHYPKLVDPEPFPESSANTEKVTGYCWSPELDGLLSPILNLFNSLPVGNPIPLTSPLTHTIHALITIPITPSLRPTWLATDDGIPDGPKSIKPSRALVHAHNLLEVSLEHYFPGSVDPDDESVRQAFAKEGGLAAKLDELLSPLAVLVTRILLEDADSRTMARNKMFPANLDRAATSPLEGRSDFLGRVLRLLKSVYHTQLKNAVGEMLFAACESDAGILSTLAGYGNVAGFLFHKGIMSAPAGSEEPSAHIDIPDSDDINPITGIATQPKSDLPEMTEEEKEREAEKLFVLFDRMEKSGMMPASSNPIRKAVNEGKLQF